MNRNIIHLDKGNVQVSKETKKQRSFTKSLSRHLLSESLGLGISLALPLVGGVLLGLYIDSIIGSRPKVTLALLFLGLIISILHMMHLARIKK